MKAKRWVSLIVAGLLLFSFAKVCFAHTTSQDGILEKASNAGSHKYFGGNDIGWIINEEAHTNGNYIKYKFATGVPQTVKNIVAGGAAIWTISSPATAEISMDSAGSGTVIMSDALPSDKAALTQLICETSTGHQISWIMYINTDSANGTATPLTSKKIAHEFGHVIGLMDIGGSSNSGKLMYSGSLASASLASIEAKGARLILGRHYSHSWEYVFYQTNSSGNNTHRRRCSYCHGIKYNSVEACTYSGGVCTKCGIPQGYSPSGIELPTATAILPDPYGEERKSYALLI